MWWKTILSGLFVTIAGGIVVWWITRPPPAPPPELPAPDPILSCSETLVGQSRVTCLIDIKGPGLLKIQLIPNPKSASWTLGVDGLIGVSSSCEFIGDIQRSMPTSIKARGTVRLICPVPANKDKPAHHFEFALKTTISNLALAIRVVFEG